MALFHPLARKVAQEQKEIPSKYDGLIAYTIKIIFCYSIIITSVESIQKELFIEKSILSFESITLCLSLSLNLQ